MVMQGMAALRSSRLLVSAMYIERMSRGRVRSVSSGQYSKHKLLLYGSAAIRLITLPQLNDSAAITLLFLYHS